MKNFFSKSADANAEPANKLGELLSESAFARIHSAGKHASCELLCEKVAERESTILLAELSEAAAQRNHRLIVDCSLVMMIASTGIGTLIQLDKLCKDAGGKFVIHSLDEQINEMLVLTHMHKLLTITGTAEQAVKALS